MFTNNMLSIQCSRPYIRVSSTFAVALLELVTLQAHKFPRPMLTICIIQRLNALRLIIPVHKTYTNYLQILTRILDRLAIKS